jgi:hypothetical protein
MRASISSGFTPILRVWLDSKPLPRCDSYKVQLIETFGQRRATQYLRGCEEPDIGHAGLSDSHTISRHRLAQRRAEKEASNTGLVPASNIDQGLAILHPGVGIVHYDRLIGGQRRLNQVHLTDSAACDYFAADPC